MLSRIHLGLRWRDFSVNLRLTLSTNAQLILKVSIRLTENYGNSIGRTKYYLSYISASVERIFLKRNTSQFPRMGYNRCKFNCYRSITKGTLHGEQCNISAAFRLPFEGISRNLTPRRVHACATNDVNFIVID